MATGKSRRSAITAGLGLAGLPLLASAQGPGPNDAPVAGPGATAGVTIGVVDIDAVFKSSRDLQAATDQIKGEIQARQKELLKMAEKGRELADDLGRSTPGSPDHDRAKGRLEEVQKQFEAAKQKAQQEFAAREAKEVAATFREIEKVVEAVAKSRGISLVLKSPMGANAEPKPEQLGAILTRSVVYADPKLDLTAEVRDRLNRR